MDESSFEARQRDELAALQSIFPDEFQLLPSIHAAWTARPLPTFSILVRGVEGSASEPCEFRIKATFPADYPRSTPQVEILESYGLGPNSLVRLRHELSRQVEVLRGAEMMYDLVSAMSEALSNMATVSGAPSLDVERGRRLAEAQAQAELSLQLEAEKIKGEQALVRQRIELELEDTGEFPPHRGPVSVAPLIDQDVVHFSRTIVLDGKWSIAAVPVGLVSSTAGVGVCAVNITQLPNIGLLVLKLMDFPSNSTPQDRQAVEEAMRQQLSHSLGDPHGTMTYTVRSPTADVWQLAVLQPHARLGSLEDKLAVVDSLSTGAARAIISDVCLAMMPFHRRGLAHGTLRPSKILFVRDGSRVCAHVADGLAVSLLRRIRGFSAAGVFDNLAYAEGLTTGADVYAIGLLLAVMLLGLDALREVDDPREALKTRFASLPSSAIHFLELCWRPQRATLGDLLATDFVRLEKIDDAQMPAMMRQRSSVQEEASSRSRYAADFEELSYLGRGGFGTVVKARNKLDGRIYAIKKIKRFREEKVLREVSGLARLNSPHIVRYFSAWIEDQAMSQPDVARCDAIGVVEDIDGEQASSDTSERRSSSSSTDAHDLAADSSTEDVHDFMSTSAMGFIQFARSRPSTKSQTPAQVVPRTQAGPSRTLYIQMELCESMTLKAWLSSDVRRLSARYWPVFSQIVSGVEYVHEQHLVHRDLKPANIFIDASGAVKLGDFGLAADIGGGTHAAAAPTSHQVRPESSSVVGTALYMAPELRKSSATYDERVDMYALGIILTELVAPVGTEMERIRLLTDARLPDVLLPLPVARFSEEIQLIRSLLSHDPSLRPTASQLRRRLPAIADQEQVAEAVKLFVRGQAHTPSLLKQLFSRVAEDTVTEHTFTPGSSHHIDPGDQEVAERVRWEVHSLVTNIFIRHGATRRIEPLVAAASTLYDEFNVVRLLDSRGRLLQLPYDMRLSWCREEGKRPHKSLVRRSFAIAHVARASSAVGQVPHYLHEADYDLSFPVRPDEADRSGELLRLLQEVDESLGRSSKTQPCIAIGHAAISRLIWDSSGISPGLYRSCGSILSSWQATQPQYRDHLRRKLVKAGMSETRANDMLDLIARSAAAADQPVALQLKHFAAVVQDRLGKDITPLIEVLDGLLQSATAFGIRLEIDFRPFTQDVNMYDIMVRLEYAQGARRETVALGGSYDRMVAICAPPGSVPQVDRSHWGVSIALDKLAQLSKVRARDITIRGSLDVLVHAPLHNPPIEVLEALWSADIAADFVTTLQPNDAQRRGALYIIVPRDRKTSTSKVRVRHLDTRQQVDLPQAEVADWVANELRLGQ